MPNFLISQRVSIDSHGQTLDVLETTYTQFFHFLGINIYPVSNVVQEIDGYLDGIRYDGLILSGGGDVSPECIENAEEDSELNSSIERERVCSVLIKKMILHDF